MNRKRQCPQFSFGDDPDPVIIIFYSKNESILEALKLASAPAEVRLSQSATKQEALVMLEVKSIRNGNPDHA